MYGLELAADLDPNLMHDEQSLSALTSRAIMAVSRTLAEVRYDAIVVQGNTTTAMCGALAAFYADVPVAHAEAGLRTGWIRSPFPEEVNRRIIGELARWHFCPTATAAAALANAPKPKKIVVTGKTAIDTLVWAMKRLGIRATSDLTRPVRRVLVTLHRRETQGMQQEDLCAMIAPLSSECGLRVTVPVHPNPTVASSVARMLGGCAGVRLVAPLDYLECVREMAQSDLILTDSGGIQEEAPTLNVPVLMLRETTERVEGVRAGCPVIAGSDAGQAEKVIRRVIDDADLRARMATATNPYGDGRAAERTTRVVLAELRSNAESLDHRAAAVEGLAA